MQFLTSFGVSALPGIGSVAVMVSFMLCVQSLCVFLIINNARLGVTIPFLTPDDFMVGVALGITIGGCILSWTLCASLGHLQPCDTLKETARNLANDTTSSATEKEKCLKLHPSVDALWFLSGLVFFLNFLAILLIAVGKQELSYPSQSQSYDGLPGGFLYPQEQQQGGGSFPGDMPPPPGASTYTSVPETNATNPSSSGGMASHQRPQGGGGYQGYTDAQSGGAAVTLTV